MADIEKGHGPHSRYRVVAEFNLETEDGDCFPSEVANATCEALRETFERMLADKLGELGAVPVYNSVSVEHGCAQDRNYTAAEFFAASPHMAGAK